MKMKTGKEGRRLSCDVWSAKKLKFQTEILCGLESDTIGYAACRFLSKWKFYSFSNGYSCPCVSTRMEAIT